MLWTKDYHVEAVTASHIVVRPHIPVFVKVWGSTATSLRAQGRVSVCQTEISLAIIHCSTQLYCSTRR